MRTRCRAINIYGFTNPMDVRGMPYHYYNRKSGPQKDEKSLLQNEQFQYILHALRCKSCMRFRVAAELHQTTLRMLRSQKVAGACGAGAQASLFRTGGIEPIVLKQAKPKNTPRKETGGAELPEPQRP